MCSIRVFAKKNMGDAYYEPTIMVHDICNLVVYKVASGSPAITPRQYLF